MRKEQWIFLQKFGSLLKASLSISEALQIAAKNIKNKKLSKIIKQIYLEITLGRSVVESFFNSGIWNQSTLALIYVGETSGSLSNNLVRAAENMRLTAQRRNQIISSLIYPVIISALAISIISFLLVYVYPKIIPLFIGMKTQLPISTRVIMGGSTFLGRYWIWFIVIPTIFASVIYYLSLEFESVKIKIEKIILSLHVIGRIIILSKLSEAAFIIGSLCDGGMNIDESIQIAEKSETFITIKKYFQIIHTEIVSGTSLSESIESKNIFPSIWKDLIIIGEKTGSLPSVFISISESHKQDIDETMALVNKLIEPMMMILVGGIVGFIALSIITPMYSLTQHVQRI